LFPLGFGDIRSPESKQDNFVRNTFITGARRLVRAWATSALIVALLATTFAICAAIFSVAYGVMWKPLPYPQQDQLVQLHARSMRMGIDLGWPAPYLDALAGRTTLMAQVSGYRSRELPVLDLAGRYAGTVDVVFAEPSLFELLGAKPVLGRLLSAEDALPGSAPVALISAAYWYSEYGGSESVLGQQIKLDGSAYRIVGVLAEAFVFPAREDKLWLPLGFTSKDTSMERAGSFGDLRAIARLAHGATIEQATEEMGKIIDREPSLSTIADQIDLRASARPLRELWTADRANSLWALLTAALLVLGLGIANAYSLHALSLLRRLQEFAILEAIGATRSQWAIQLTCEAMLLGLVAALLAIGALPFGIIVLQHLDVLPADLPLAIGIDAAAFGCVAAMATVAFAMLASAGLILRRGSLSDAVRQSGAGQTASVHTGRFRKGLVVAQMAITFVLLATTGLLVHSSYRLLRQDVGFDRSDQFVAQLQPVSSPDEDPMATRIMIAGLVDDISSMPGVKAVGLTTTAPFSKNVELEAFQTNDTQRSSDHPKAYFSFVNEGYAQAVGLRVLEGRSFSKYDAEKTAAVALIDEDIARRHFSGIDPVGAHMAVADPESGQLVDVEIVGVVERARHRTLASRDEYPSIYRPAAVPFAVPGVPLSSVELVVRAHDPVATVAMVQQRLKVTGNRLRLVRPITMESRIAETIVESLRLSDLLQIFGAVATALSAAGLYALLSSAVATRQREFGVRQALGASPGALFTDVLGRGARMIGFALAVGFPIALVSGFLLQSRLHQISFADPLSLLAASTVMVAVGFVANVVPALRAMRIKPMSALRTE
jgi:predicted permease